MARGTVRDLEAEKQSQWWKGYNENLQARNPNQVAQTGYNSDIYTNSGLQRDTSYEGMNRDPMAGGMTIEEELAIKERDKLNDLRARANLEQSKGLLGPASKELARLEAIESTKVTGPSAAELQQRQGFQELMAQQASLAASDPSVDPAAAQRQAMRTSATLGQDMASEGAILRANEAQANEQRRLQYEEMNLSSAAESAGLAGQAEDRKRDAEKLRISIEQFEAEQKAAEDQRWWDLAGSILGIGGMVAGGAVPMIVGALSGKSSPAPGSYQPYTAKEYKAAQSAGTGQEFKRGKPIPRKNPI